MQISTCRNGDQLVVQLSAVPEHLIPGVEREDFTRQDDCFVKSFPADAPGMEHVVNNLTRYAGELFNLKRRDDQALWPRALADCCDRLAGTGIDWFLMGSCALAVRGIPLAPGGVDLVFPSAGCLSQVRDLFGDQAVQPITECADWVALAYGAAFHLLPLTFAFETQPVLDYPEPIDSGPYAAGYLEQVAWQGRLIKLPPLALSRNINLRRNRPDRVQLIDEYLASKHAQ